MLNRKTEEERRVRQALLHGTRRSLQGVQRIAQGGEHICRFCILRRTERGEREASQRKDNGKEGVEMGISTALCDGGWHPLRPFLSLILSMPSGLHLIEDVFSSCSMSFVDLVLLISFFLLFPFALFSISGLHLNEDVFAAYNSLLRGGGSTGFVDFVQIGKGRDTGMQQLTAFEAKIASGQKC